MSNDNFTSEDDYIRSLVIHSYNLTDHLLEFDRDHDTSHTVSCICASINMVARSMDMSPKDMAECIYNIVCRVTDEGGDES